MADAVLLTQLGQHVRLTQRAAGLARKAIMSRRSTGSGTWYPIFCPGMKASGSVSQRLRLAAVQRTPECWRAGE